ncbi:MAG: serine hydrolase [Paenibacillus sp.]|nr:serine hydrolase [Paenibacillus sp.]
MIRSDTQLQGLEHAEQMGLNRQKVLNAFDCLDQAVHAQIIPGGVASVTRRGYTITYTTGSASIRTEQHMPVQLNTCYDCASLTKVVVTLPLVLQLIERGRLRLDDTVANYLPSFATAGKAAVTVGQLLTHTAGLKPFMNLHAHGWTREEMLARVLAEPLGHEPGTQVVYSDLGFIVLGQLAELLHEQPLEQAAERHVLMPLGMMSSGFRPLQQLSPSAPTESIFAPTEWSEDAQAYRVGTVHDENASAMGGVSGHAGLFSTVQDLSRYALMWLNEGVSSDGVRILSPATVRAAIRSHTDALASGNRGLGWVLKGDSFDASGDLMSSKSYGHTGFTGTSLYVEPEYGLTVVLLTNRVHYGRSQSVAPLRACFHNAILGCLNEQ